MGTVEIRDAVEADLSAVRDVFRRASWANEGDRPLLERHPEFLVFTDLPVLEGRTRVALIDGRLVGFASTIDEGAWLELEDLFVDPDWMRHGVGRALVSDIVERARVAGIPEIAVDGNTHALEFYEQVGFVAGATVALEHGTAVRMTLIV